MISEILSVQPGCKPVNFQSQRTMDREALCRSGVPLSVDPKRPLYAVSLDIFAILRVLFRLKCFAIHYFIDRGQQDAIIMIQPLHPFLTMQRFPNFQFYQQQGEWTWILA